MPPLTSHALATSILSFLIITTFPAPASAYPADPNAGPSTNPPAISTPTIDDRPDDCFEQNCTLFDKEDETACISSQTMLGPQYPDWFGSPLAEKDCLDAWKVLKLRLASQSQQQRPWTYWYQEPAPRTALNHRTPFGEEVGSCYVGLAMFRQIPETRGEDRLLNPKMLPGGYRSLKTTDEAIFARVHDAVDRNAWCLRQKGLPAGWYTGATNSIGVFFWPSDSAMRREYGEPKVRGGEQLMGPFPAGAASLAGSPTA